MKHQEGAEVLGPAEEDPEKGGGGYPGVVYVLYIGRYTVWFRVMAHVRGYDDDGE